VNKVIVTGVNGLVGRAVAQKLSQGYVVCGIDVGQLANDFCCEYLECDVTDNSIVELAYMKFKKSSVVIHCAATLNNESIMAETNIGGTKRIMDVAKKLNCETFIYVSSVQVIGVPVHTPICENHPVNPLSYYHLTKYCGEKMFELPQYKFKKSCVLRIPSPVGIGMPDDRFFSVIIDRINRNMPIYLHGNGARIQNYIDVRDIARAMELVINSPDSDGLSIIKGFEISNKELALLCKEVIGSKCDLLYSGTEDQEENIRWIFSGEIAKDRFGYMPMFTLVDMINVINEEWHLKNG
jgi:UDP-glucose 4-epimerase